LRDDGSIVRAMHLKPSPFPALSSIAALGGCQPSAVCALRRDATVACAATGEFPKEFPITSTPLAALHDIVRVASTASSACALARDGSVRCWGDHGLAPNLRGAADRAGENKNLPRDAGFG
jgi:hypothetical protein